MGDNDGHMLRIEYDILTYALRLCKSPESNYWNLKMPHFSAWTVEPVGIINTPILIYLQALQNT